MRKPTPLVNINLTLTLAWKYVFTTRWILCFVGLFILYLFTLQWLFNLDQLIEVVLGDSGLNFADRVDFLVDGFLNIFRYAADPVPIAMIGVSLFESLALTLVIMFGRSLELKRTILIAPTVLGVAGVGCVACGGSILTAAVQLVLSSASITMIAALSRLLLFGALVVSYIAMNRISFLVASELHNAHKKHEKNHSSTLRKT